MMAHVLRVAVHPDVAAGAPRSGHGRVWRRVLAELEGRVRLDVRPSGRRLARRPDVWLADGHRPLPAVAEPLVAQVHEPPPRDPAARALLDPAFLAGLERAVAATVGRADVVITPSAFAAGELRAAYGPAGERVRHALHGVDADRFRPGLAGGRERIGAPYVAYVGVLHPRKNLGALREAMARLIARGAPHSLAVVWSPPADRADPAALVRDALAELPGAPGRLVALRDLDDEALAAVLAGADAFCLPSLSEGFGLPALEAMACGAPVVAAARGALPEVVGEAGLLVEPTADACEAALDRVLTDGRLARDLRERGRRRALELPWSRTADGWVAALEHAATTVRAP